MNYIKTTVIFFDKNNKAYKYRNIDFDPETEQFKDRTFLPFVTKKGGLTMNIYNKESKQFISQLKKQ